ncbi:MAG: two-component system sensor histidine kinase NtrB [Isosphaeraceae bacterium]
MNLLIVDDDRDTRKNLRDILELDGYRIDEAATVAEALERVARVPYSAILLDRKLPDGTADDLLPRLKQLSPSSDVLILTGFSDVEGAISALRFGAADYLLKPINPEELSARLARLAARRRAEDELRKRSLILQSVLKHVADAAIVTDRHGRILLYSTAVERLVGPIRLGAPPDEWPTHGRFFRADMVTPYALQELPLSRALRGEEVVDEEVFVRPSVDDPGRWVSASASPLRDADGLQGAVVIYHDVTERRIAANELRRQRDLAAGLIAAAPSLVLLLDPRGRITLFNHFAEELSGYSAAEVQGWDFFTRLLPERFRDRIATVFRDTLEGMDTSGTINPILTRDGREREIRWFNGLLRDADGRITGILAIGQDITDLKEAQERALRSERLAAIGEMVAGLAHESRNALQRGQACLEMLAIEVRDRPRATDLVARIQHAQDDLIRLYEEVRDFAAPIALRPLTCNLREAWRTAWRDLEPTRRDQDAVLRERIDVDDLECRIDPFRMIQVFRNLMENALTACPDPVQITIACSPASLDGRDALRISVSDTGPGLSPDQRARAFDAFYTTKIKGTGLGLAICRRIIEAHSGRIELADRPDQGAEFVILLPRGNP